MEAWCQCLLELMQVQLADDEEDELFTQILLAPMENVSRCQHGGSMLGR